MLGRHGPGTSTELLSYSIYKVAFRYFDLGRGAAMASLMLAVVLLLSTKLMNRIAAEEFGQ